MALLQTYMIWPLHQALVAQLTVLQKKLFAKSLFEAHLLTGEA
jgi:hypothetical protein